MRRYSTYPTPAVCLDA